MKGLIYNTVIQNKVFYIVGISLWAAVTLLCAVLISLYPNNAIITEISTVLVPLFMMLILMSVFCDSIIKNNERMMKCGFTKYMLTTGVTPFKIAVKETAENILLSALGFGLSAGCYLILFSMLYHVPSDFFFIKIMLIAALWVCIYTSLVNTVTYFTRDSHISSLIVLVGLALVFGAFAAISKHTVASIDFDKALIAEAIITAVIYIISCAAITFRLKRSCV